MTQPITLLGATGSIGRSTLDVVEHYSDRFHIHAIAGGNRVDELVEVAAHVHPKHVVIANPVLEGELREKLSAAGLTSVNVGAGEAAVATLASDPETEVVVQAIVGAAGVAPTFAAAKAGKRLLLANKESVVCGGALLMRTIKEHGAELLPVDSEHNAIFQCLVGATPKARAEARLLLTASGGPFRGCKDLSGITPAQAVAHPRWKMGRKISVDSATLMNKGLEVIEARWLFDFTPDRIDVVVHPESIIHSAVEYADGAVIAQLGTADMREPIAYSLGWPERMDGHVKRLKLAEIGKLTFEEPDLETFPLLSRAYSVLRAGDASSIVLNAADEIAVGAFLDRGLPFTSIVKVVDWALEHIQAPLPKSVDDIIALDREVRVRVADYVASLSQEA